jgi:nitrogen regulatory protein P-II 2
MAAKHIDAPVPSVIFAPAAESQRMKLITAIFKPSRLDAVIEALSDVGASGMTVTEVRGYGRQKGKTEVYRGAEYEVRLLPKVKVDVACASADADRFADAIIQAANTNTIGDGKIFIVDLGAAIRIRTGERDANAISG